MTFYDCIHLKTSTGSYVRANGNTFVLVEDPAEGMMFPIGASDIALSYAKKATAFFSLSHESLKIYPTIWRRLA